MAVSRSLLRLLRVLELEEEQARGSLESALAEVRRIDLAQSSAIARERAGRRWVASSARSGELADRLGGLEQVRAARRWLGILKARAAEAEKDAAARREAFLAKRLERRQTETLIEEAQAREEMESNRRGQQALDEWFLNRRRGAGSAQNTGAGTGDNEPAADGKEI